MKKFEVAIRTYTVVEARDEKHAMKIASENLTDCMHDSGENDTRICGMSMDDISVLPWTEDEQAQA